MKAYRVFYSTAGKSTQMTVIAEDEASLEEAVSRKDKDYRIGDRYSSINTKQEIPLSNVMVSSLSVTELLELIALKR